CWCWAWPTPPWRCTTEEARPAMPSSLRNPKTLAAWIRLDYFRRPGLLRRLWWPAVLLALAASRAYVARALAARRPTALPARLRRLRRLAPGGRPPHRLPGRARLRRPRPVQQRLRPVPRRRLRDRPPALPGRRLRPLGARRRLRQMPYRRGPPRQRRRRAPL